MKSGVYPGPAGPHDGDQRIPGVKRENSPPMGTTPPREARGGGNCPSVIAPVADPEKPSGAYALLSIAVPKYNKKFKRLPFWTADDDFFAHFARRGVKSSQFAGSAANNQAAQSAVVGVATLGWYLGRVHVELLAQLSVLLHLRQQLLTDLG